MAILNPVFTCTFNSIILLLCINTLTFLLPKKQWALLYINWESYADPLWATKTKSFFLILFKICRFQNVRNHPSKNKVTMSSQKVSQKCFFKDWTELTKHYKVGWWERHLTISKHSKWCLGNECLNSSISFISLNIQLFLNVTQSSLELTTWKRHSKHSSNLLSTS